MTATLRGADIVVRTLEMAGHTKIFTLSGNHIMSLFDAAIESKLELFHVRHEAATVHMADSFGRLTGKPGIAWVTGGPGHANAVGSLFTALGQETPMVLMSGHTETDQLGKGGFQELKQVEMAAPVTKASWMSTDARTVGMDVAKALKLSVSGRPGPVHLSLPSDILDAVVPVDQIAWPTEADWSATPAPLNDHAADTILSIVRASKRPLLIGAPVLANAHGRAAMRALQDALGAPGCLSEGPRGFNDATLGLYGDVAKKADLVVLIGKALDFTLKFGAEPFFDKGCRFVSIDPDGALIARTFEFKGDKLAFACIAETHAAIATLIARSAGGAKADPAWRAEAENLFAARPDAVKTAVSKTDGKLHPAEVFRTLGAILDRDPNAVLICDGGEFAQWGQSMLRNDRRMINGVAGSIGSSLPMAAGARVVEEKSPVFAVLGDGTFGFHMSELETAVRLNLPFVAVVGTDSRWNAEYNLQVRDYGPNRTFGCELNPTRYDLVATGLGGHGELVEKAADLGPALERALASGKPAVVNVMIESIPSPVVRR